MAVIHTQRPQKGAKRGKRLGLANSHVDSYIRSVVKYPRANFHADSIKTVELYTGHTDRHTDTSFYILRLSL